MNDPNFDRQSMSAFVGLILLSIRGLLLWIVVPVSLCFWIVTWPIQRRHSIRLAAFLGWADLFLISIIERSVLRPFVDEPIGFIPLKDISKVTHRIGAADLM